MCKSLLHGPRNYVDRTWERSANYSAPTFSCFHAKPKYNFSSSSVRWIHNVRAIAADCVRGFVFWGGNMVREFAKLLIRLGQWSEWNFWRAINVQCVTRIGTISILVKLQHLHELSSVSGSRLPYGKVYSPFPSNISRSPVFALTYITSLDSHLVLNNWN